MAKVGIKALPVVTITTSAKQITTSKIFASMIEIHTLTTNSGAAYIGGSNVLTTTHIPVASNSFKSYSANEVSSGVTGDYFDLSEIYVVGTAGDLLRVQYIARV